MTDLLNWLWLLAGSAFMVVFIGLVARMYWWLFTLGWGLL